MATSILKTGYPPLPTPRHHIDFPALIVGLIRSSRSLRRRESGSNSHPCRRQSKSHVGHPSLRRVAKCCTVHLGSVDTIEAYLVLRALRKRRQQCGHKLFLNGRPLSDRRNRGPDPGCGRMGTAIRQSKDREAIKREYVAVVFYPFFFLWVLCWMTLLDSLNLAILYTFPQTAFFFPRDPRTTYL